MAKRTKSPAAALAKAVEIFRAGATTARAAELAGVPYRHAYLACVKAGVHTPRVESDAAEAMAKAIEAVRGGETMAAAARAAGLGYYRVVHACQARGVNPSRSKAVGEGTLAAIADMLNTDLDAAEIASRRRVSPSRIHQIRAAALEAGIRIRPLSPRPEPESKPCDSTSKS